MITQDQLSPFEEQLKAQLADRNFWPTQADFFLIGYSGGPDSQALVHALMRLKTHTNGVEHLRHAVFVLCHFDHGWRPEEREKEKHFIEAVASSWNLPLISSNVEKMKKRASNQDLPEDALGETSARLYRHAFFKQIREGFEKKQDKAPYLLLAHHADDRVETLLLNLFRGSGIDGLCAMPARQGYVLRPLLNFSKAEIMDYLHASKVEYLIDVSNEEGFTPRNRLRLELLPLLRGIVPQAETQILRFSKQLESLRKDWITPLLEEYSDRLAPAGKAIALGQLKLPLFFSISKSDLKAVPESLRPLFWKKHLAEFFGTVENMGEVHFQLLEEHLKAQGQRAQIFYRGSHLCSDRHEIRLWLKPCNELKTSFVFIRPETENGPLRMLLCQSDKEEGETAELFEKAKRLGYNFLTWFSPDGVHPQGEWRQRQEGDYLVLKQGQRKTLKKFMSEQRIPFEIRNLCLLFCHNQEVKCLPSYFVRKSAHKLR